jgi:hypothetical protein
MAEKTEEIDQAAKLRKLRRIALSLLRMWYDAETLVIWDRSGRIGEDQAEIRARTEKIERLIQSLK